VQAVDGAQACGDGLFDVAAVQRRDGLVVDAARFGEDQRAFAVDGLAETAEDSAQELIGAPDARGGGNVFDAIAARDA
jgi:hypothetical protein